MSKRPASDHYEGPHKKRNLGPDSSSPTLPTSLPPLPQLAPDYAAGPFIHKSAAVYSRNSKIKDLSYERLEFLGDAYIELIASEIIYARFPYLPAGQMSQLRESLVRNDTLAEYSVAYGFDKRIELDSFRQMEAGASKGNKGLKKVFGDVFEAYLAAVVLSDPKDGRANAEKWLAALWEPRLVMSEKGLSRSAYGPPPVSDTDKDPLNTYNPDAKQELSRRIVYHGKEVKLTYESWRDMIELKGAQIGQSRHFIAVYLTGFGFEKKLLGKGEGKNRGEAGQWAATDAMHGGSKELVAQCEKQCTEIKEKRKREQEARP